MPIQRYRVAAVNTVTRSVVNANAPVPLVVTTAEVRASPVPLPKLSDPAGWSANTPTLDIQFTVWGPSVKQYQPGFEFDLTIP